MPELEEQTETAPVEEQETVDTTEVEASEETENTDTTEEKPDAMIPKSRFDEVIGQRNELRKETEALSARLERLEAEIAKVNEKKEPETGKRTAPQPPAHLSDDEKVAWLIKHHAGEYINEELGMSLKEAKALLGTTRETSSDYAVRRWQKACADYGLDPADKDVQTFVYGLARGQEKPDQDAIFKKAKAIFGKKPAPKGNGEQKQPEEPTATAEETGVTGVMTGDKRLFRNAKEATEAALKGQVATHEDLDEILERFDKAAKK